MDQLNPLPLLQALVLAGAANGIPILAKWWLGDHWARPLDGGFLFFDGEPILGKSKTIRGIVLAVGTTTLASGLMGLGLSTGLFAGAAAMAGDLLSSFTKRRLKLKPSSRAPGLDQVPESLLPLLVVSGRLGLNAMDILGGVAAFWVGEIVLSRILFRLKIRDRPY